MSHPSEGPLPPPGWYPDPWGTAPLRWWNGQQWTPRTRAATQASVETALPLTIPHSQFWSDLKVSAITCIRGRWLLTTTLAIQVVPAILSAVAGDDSLGVLELLAALIELATIGFYGTQRVWLFRLFRDGGLSASEAYTLTKGYFRRFFGLGVRVFLLFLPFGLLIPVVSVATRSNAATLVTAAVVGYLLDVLMTFVVPELTFRAHSAKEAWQSGRMLLRESWPQSRWYVLAPGIALLAVSNALGGYERALWIVIPESAVSAVLALVFRGTILAYYLRVRPDTHG